MSAIERLCDYLPLARARLGEPLWRYLQEGSSDQAIDANARALAAVRLWPRPLRDLSGGHTRLQLYGQQLDHPILLAPIAYQRLFHADGECASALAATAQGGQMLVSSLASQPFEQIAKAGHGEQGRPWFQLYWQGNRERTLRLLQRASAAGFSVVVLTIDAPIKRSSLQLPNGVSAVNLDAVAPPEPVDPALSRVFDGWMKQAPTWNDVTWLRQQTKLPLLLKGITHPDDADQALNLGCDGIIVSNHGGRVLDGAPASIDLLPAISARIAGRMPILFDSGIRSGHDLFIALALGATAVLIGRPFIWGLACNGALGVAHAVRLLRDELEMTMALTGCARLSEIGPHCLADRAVVP